MESGLRDKLRDEVRVTDWRKLSDFIERDAVIIVSEELDLLEVAENVVKDNKDVVSTWVEGHLVTKPNNLQLRNWDEAPSRRFQCLVVYPYVLVQSVAS